MSGDGRRKSELKIQKGREPLPQSRVLMLWAEGPGSRGCGGEPTHNRPLRSDTMQSDGRELKFFTYPVHGPVLNKGPWPSDWQLEGEGRGETPHGLPCVGSGQLMGTGEGTRERVPVRKEVEVPSYGDSGWAPTRGAGQAGLQSGDSLGSAICPGVSAMERQLRLGVGGCAQERCLDYPRVSEQGKAEPPCRAFLDPAAQTSWTSNQLTWRTSRR